MREIPDSSPTIVNHRRANCKAQAEPEPPLDYIVGAALIAAPWIFQFSEHTASYRKLETPTTAAG